LTIKQKFTAILFTVFGFVYMTGSATAATSGTPVTLSTVLAFQEDTACRHTPNSPCPANGTFTANDETTANIICESGTIFETHWFTHGRGGPITIADRTWTCPDGSTLVMHVLRWVFYPGSGNDSANSRDMGDHGAALVDWHACRPLRHVAAA
jgi:hypothetical protein